MLLETEILNKYKSGELNGIYATELCFYMPIRITGTGLTIRKNGDQYYICDRPKDVFLTDEIIQACANIPIIIQHPESNNNEIADKMLSYKTIKNSPIIGQTIYAYIVGEEIWAIGRIYDFDLLDKLNNDIHSTSPAVFSGEIDEKNGITKEIPFIINHIAFVDKGHWDQKSEVAYDDSVITIQGVNEMEDKNQPSVLADESTEEKVEEIQKAESEEAQHFQEMAEEHKEAVKADEQEQESKPQEGETQMVEEEIKTDETTVVDEEPTTEAIVNEPVEPQVDEDDIPEEVTAQTEADDDDVITDEAETIEDKERESIIDTMTELADSLDEEVGFKKIFAKNREKPSSLMKRILANNHKLLDKKYRNLSLTDSVNDLNYGLAVDAFNNLIENAQAKHKEIAKTKHTKSGAKWEPLAENIYVDRSF